MLGRWQREVLQRYADCLHVGSEPNTIRITVGRYSRFTREAGGGSGHPIIVGIFYPSEPEFFSPRVDCHLQVQGRCNQEGAGDRAPPARCAWGG